MPGGVPVVPAVDDDGARAVAPTKARRRRQPTTASRDRSGRAPVAPRYSPRTATMPPRLERRGRARQNLRSGRAAHSVAAARSPANVAAGRRSGCRGRCPGAADHATPAVHSAPRSTDESASPDPAHRAGPPPGWECASVDPGVAAVRSAHAEGGRDCPGAVDREPVWPATDIAHDCAPAAVRRADHRCPAIAEASRHLAPAPSRANAMAGQRG